MLFYPSTNYIKLNATIDFYIHNEYVYSQYFFAIAKRSQYRAVGISFAFCDGLYTYIIAENKNCVYMGE